MKSADAEQNWKHKYYKSLEELEQKEAQWAELEHLLKNTTIKMSLALDGLDYSFDKTLNELRKTLRGQATPYQIKKIIYSITAGLDKLEAASKDSSTVHGDTWRVLLDLCQSLKLPKTFKKPLQTLNKQLLKSNSETDLKPAIGSLKKILNEALHYYEEIKNQCGDKPGMFGGLFKKKSQAGDDQAKSEENVSDSVLLTAQEAVSTAAAADKPEHSNPAPESIRSGLDVLNLLVNRLQQNTSLASALERDANRLAEIQSGQQLLELTEAITIKINHYWPPQSAQAKASLSLNEAMLILLDKISLPVKLNKKIEKLQAILEHGVKDEDWPKLLDKIAKIVSQVRDGVQKEKKELESFLSDITSRLQAIDDAIQGMGSDNTEFHKQSLHFNRAVTQEVAELRTEIKGKSDMTPLKRAIETRLDAIAQHMEDYKHKEEIRSQRAQEKVRELSARLQKLEAESNELKSKVIKQRKQAMLDRLTGVPNRAAYDERLDQEYRRWRRFHDHLCLVVVDIDHFKKVNDSFGHKAGDRVLAKVGQLISERIRETDFVARYGGEEFVIIMTGANQANAITVANEIRAAIEQCGFHFRDQEVPVTVSAGIAQFQGNDTPDDVFERADKALYEAKNAGRNQCRST